jgi:uncharacterized membrane protein
MIWLILGVLLFAGVHVLPTAPAMRGRLVERLGEQPYKGLFSLGIVGGIALMVIGWRASVPSYLYAPPSWGAAVAVPLVFAALVLFVASNLPTNLKRLIRHPQLTGVATWAVAHLLANGDSRSLVLFGGIGLWAVVEMGLLSRRDGAWQRPEPLPLAAELKPLIGAAVAFAVLFLLHPYIAGVSPRLH